MPGKPVQKSYRLLAPNGDAYESPKPGTLGGYFPLKIYGRLDCWSAKSHLSKGGYAHHRVFFADEAAAIAAGFRPCGHCLSDRYKLWKLGGIPGSEAYPWKITPPPSK